MGGLSSSFHGNVCGGGGCRKRVATATKAGLARAGFRWLAASRSDRERFGYDDGSVALNVPTALAHHCGGLGPGDAPRPQGSMYRTHLGTFSLGHGWTGKPGPPPPIGIPFQSRRWLTPRRTQENAFCKCISVIKLKPAQHHLSPPPLPATYKRPKKHTRTHTNNGVEKILAMN